MSGAPVRTTCPYCGVGCGVLARREGARIEIAGDPRHPANLGRLCSKGSALAETLGTDGRLLYPSIHGKRASWNDALDTVASGFDAIIREHGPDAVAFYVSGQLLTEDYYVANKLMKGFIGSANIDTNSRLCMSSAVAGHRRAFGEDLVPGCYEDFELADLVVLVGSNSAWCHPILHQRILRARERRPQMRLVVIDPRRTPTCESANLHLALRAGSDVWLFNGLLAYLQSRNDPGIDEVARQCGLARSEILEFYELFARTDRVVTAFSMGVNQSSSGTDKVSSIINCHVFTGRIGRPGMGPFSITGQPNAMGGREVGGMANMLAVHMELSNPDHRQIVQAFWSSPRIAERRGLEAVELFDAIHAGRVKAVWIMATNPVVSLPEADRVREALARCALVVVSDVIAKTDTSNFAHVLLPAAAWGEKDGTVTNSERRISRQRAFLDLPGEAKPDWWIVCEVARRMGFARAFGFESAHEIFSEHARLSQAGNEGSRVFDIGALATLTAPGFEALEPIQWPVTSEAPNGTARLLLKGRITPTPPRSPAFAVDDAFPFVLNTGRIRDQWHTMTRTGASPRLSEHSPEPFVDMHAHDALIAGIREGELARVVTNWGSLVARLQTSGQMARGTIFVPIHWSAANASDARVGALVNPVVDPESGEPEFKHTPARVEPFRVDWYGFILSRRPLAVLDATWWTRIKGQGFERYEFAGRGELSAWASRITASAGSDCLDYHDAVSGVYRAAVLVDDCLDTCLFTSSRPQLPERGWLGSLFAKPKLDARDRIALLAGKPPVAGTDSGPLVCSCHGVRRNAIVGAIREHSLRNVDGVGRHTRAGTNCGSCAPEILRILNAGEGLSRAVPP